MSWKNKTNKCGEKSKVTGIPTQRVNKWWPKNSWSVATLATSLLFITVVIKYSRCSAVKACVCFPESPVRETVYSEFRRWERYHYLMWKCVKNTTKEHMAENSFFFLHGLLNIYSSQLLCSDDCNISLMQSNIYLWSHRRFCFPVSVPVNEFPDWVHQFGVLRTHG